MPHCRLRPGAEAERHPESASRGPVFRELRSLNALLLFMKANSGGERLLAFTEAISDRAGAELKPASHRAMAAAGCRHR
jgi:hypothetical protein